MKNKITLASAFLAAASLATAEIVINDFLSFEGFVDMSYSHVDVDEGGSDNSYGLDQVEINWLFDFDQVSGVVDFAYYGSEADNTAISNNDETQLEQAYVTYSFDDGTALTAGRFQSMLGFEAFEPTGLYQKSFAYDAETNILPSYGEGVKYTYESGDAFFGVALINSYNSDARFTNGRSGRLGGSGDSDYAVEVAGSYLTDGLTLFLGGYFENRDSSEPMTPDGSTYVINAYATYETGAWLFAGEVNFGNSESDAYGLSDVLDETVARGANSDDDAMSALIMANYAYNEAASITGRISYESLDFSKSTFVNDTGIFEAELETKQTKYTLAHGYAFTDNLFLVTEISFIQAEIDLPGLGSLDADGLEGAVELIFAF